MAEEKDKITPEEQRKKLEKEFQKKIEEMKKRDPFVYKNF